MLLKYQISTLSVHCNEPYGCLFDAADTVLYSLETSYQAAVECVLLGFLLTRTKQDTGRDSIDDYDCNGHTFCSKSLYSILYQVITRERSSVSRDASSTSIHPSALSFLSSPK